MEEILVVSHCILNPASKVVSYNLEEINEETAKREKLLDYIIKHNIRMIQLPCPEFIMYGAARWGHVKEQFNHPFFRKQCRMMLEPVILQLKEYMQYPERFNITAIVAIDGSPSCGYNLTCRGEWGGEFSNCPDFENKINSLNMSKESGAFMEN
jgi:predicted secreted protein